MDISRSPDLDVHDGYRDSPFLLKENAQTTVAKPGSSGKGLMYRVLSASWSQRPRPFRDNKWLLYDWPMLVVDHRFVPNPPPL